MDKSNADGNFAPFPYFTKGQSGKEEENSYLVYTSTSECKRVKAHSAAAAMRVAGVSKPFKIVRFDPLNQVLLPQGNFQ